MRTVIMFLALGAFLFSGAAGATDGFPGMKPEWSIDFSESVIGGPVHFGDVESTRGVLVTLASGKVVLVDTHGHVAASAKLDLPSDSPAVAGRLLPGESLAIVAADVWGSLYAFNEKGKRLWKFARLQKARNLRLPVLADLDGDGGLDIVMTDSRGHLFAVDGHGRAKFEVTATRYRVSVPSIGDVNRDGKPEIVFGTDDGDVYALDRSGGTLWSTKLRGCFGRSLPLVADTDHDGNYEIYLPNSFNLRGGKGLFALDAATGKTLWMAQTVMQSYRSTAVADLDGDGRDEILFGDKNTRLYCLDTRGGQRWSTQLDGRGIYFAPVVADLEGNGRPTIFAIVRGVGVNGRSLYILNAAGKVADSLPLSGGGASSPILCRFANRKEVSLLVLSGSGKLSCYRLPQEPETARILWPGLRNNPLNSGFVRSRARGTRGPRMAARPLVMQLPITMPRAEERPAQPVVAIRQIVNPWSNAMTTAPPGPITVSMLGNEYESAAIAVTNLEARTATFRLECGPFRSKTKSEVPAGKVIEFRRVLRVLPNTTGEPTEDALPRLGEAHAIRLGPGETCKLWLTLRSRDLPAGRYTATIRFSDLLSLAPPLVVPVHVKVYPVRLPAHFQYRFCNWLNLTALREETRREAVIQDALEHYTNVFVIPPVTFPVDAGGNLGEPDGGMHDALVRRLRGKAIFLIAGSVRLQWPAGANPDAEARRKHWADAVRRYAAHMRELGCRYDDWAYYLLDEPGLLGPGPRYDAWVKLVKKVKAADPRAHIYANPTGGARPAMLQRVEKLIDIWAPSLPLLREHPRAFGKLFGRAGNYWYYEAPAGQRNLDPLGYYRMQPWIAFQMGMNGAGYWVHHYQDLWFPNPAIATEYGALYVTGSGPVTTKRWEASREGIEDYELLMMLRDSARRKQSGNAGKALALIKEAVAFVTRGQDQVTDISRHLHPYTPNYGKWMKYRNRLIQMEIRLAKEQ